MIDLLDIFLCALLAVLAVPVVLLLVQVLMAMPGIGRAAMPPGRRPRLAVVMPAHNEAAGIAGVIDRIEAELVTGDRLLVVADNCTDGTARIAATCGALVRERTDASLRGKGYALDFGMRCLAEDPPEVVIIIDADCLVTPGAIERIARLATVSGRPVQALYLMRSPACVSAMRKIAEFAWIVKNLVRPLGFHHLGLPCQLMGTGMAFPWAMISTVSLASGHIVEDMKLGADLAGKGSAPLFCPQAVVYSHFPANEEGSRSQRTRWEHGHLGMIVSGLPQMLRDAVSGRNGKLFALALDMSIPPVALLTLLVLAGFVLAGVANLLSGPIAAFVVAASLLSMLTMAILLAWARFGREAVSGANLLLALWYVFLKLPLYLKFLVNRQVEWVRSKRDAE